MSEIVIRSDDNPILTPQDIPPSIDGFQVECILNPGVFSFQGKIWLLLRVAERPPQIDGSIRLPIYEDGAIRIIEFDKDDPDLNTDDPRVIFHKDKFYLTTLSHLRLVSSEDGVKFHLADNPPICGSGPLEAYGIEDCRVAHIENLYYLTYTAVSSEGVGVGMMNTSDWSEFSPRRIMISGPNKDCALFEEQIKGRYYCFHRPGMGNLGGYNLWLSTSPNLIHWGNHRCIAKTRSGMWDSRRIGAGASPIKTERGWLEIYHGADDNSRYCLGALLLDLEDPSRVLARSHEPFMEPVMSYEKNGFFGSVIFTNGHTIEGDTVTLYYGASDTVVCMAKVSIDRILSSLV